MERADARGIYVEVTVWTLRDSAAASRFTKVMQTVVDDDRQGEAYFQVFPLPKSSRFGTDMLSTEEPVRRGSPDQRFLTVSVGSCEQFDELCAPTPIYARASAPLAPLPAVHACATVAVYTTCCRIRASVLKGVLHCQQLHMLTKCFDRT